MKILLIWLLISGTALAQSSARFTITRSVVAGGGAAVGSSHFQLAGTAGQPLAAVPGSAHFSIQGCFWIVPAPIFFGSKAAGTNFVLSVQSELGKNYTVQYKNVLGMGWQSLAPVAGTGGIITITNGGAGVAQRFYRLVEH